MQRILPLRPGHGRQIPYSSPGCFIANGTVLLCRGKRDTGRGVPGGRGNVFDLLLVRK